MQVGSAVVCAAGRRGPKKGAVSPVLLVQPRGNGKAALVL